MDLSEAYNSVNSSTTINTDETIDKSLIEYQWLPQPVFLDKLSTAGINLTAVTLRNYEKYSLIITPMRAGKRGGRITKYCEYSLAEVFAAYTLLLADLPINVNGEVITLPRFSLRQLSMARQQLWQSGVQVNGFQNPMIFAKGKTYYPKQPLNPKLPKPDFVVGDDNILQIITLESSNVGDPLMYHFFQTIYLAWFTALKTGCEKFLSDYKC